MQKDDMVLLTSAGELRFIPPDRQGQAEGDDGDDQIIGTVVDVRDPAEDSIIALRTSIPNVSPVLARLAEVREQYQKQHGAGGT
jgi:hypothetical protein